MFAIFKKDLKHFLNNLTGIVSVIVFLFMNGVFLFLFEDTNLLEYGFASYSYFFDITPFTLIFLIAAICMKSFSEEFKSGTFEILASRPLRSLQIIIGKIFASGFIVLVALIPTFFYVYTLSALSLSDAGLDLGEIFAAYSGLLFLSIAFISVSIYCSSLTKNNITAFLFSIAINYFFYDGLDQISKLHWFQNDFNFLIEMTSLSYHFKSMAKGVIDFRDIVFFLSLILFFIFLTKQKLRLNK